MDYNAYFQYFVIHKRTQKCFQASERQLNPIRKESTPVELLMESIRNSDARASLRKTGGPRRRPQGNSIS